MIHPNMATLLGIMCTDAPIAAAALSSALSHAVARSFNSISIDGDTSTNHTVALLANGAAAPQGTSLTVADEAAFRARLTAFALRLSRLVVRDGEGATKFVTGGPSRHGRPMGRNTRDGGSQGSRGFRGPRRLRVDATHAQSSACPGIECRVRA